MDEQRRLREEIGKGIEKLRQLNNTLLEAPDSDQETMDVWQNTIRHLYQIMKQTLIEAGKTYLVNQLHTCWTCNQQGKTDSTYTSGIIFCNNTKCKDHFYYWSMCQALYGGLPEEIFKEAMEEMEKQTILYH